MAYFRPSKLITPRNYFLMKRLLFSFCMLGFAAISLQAQVIFSEDFDGVGGPTAGGAGTYVFPSGWYLRNVDNGTPAAQTAYINDAWERREDFNFNVADSCAFSTSYYSPAGAADDWMWTPLIGPLPSNSIVSWNAVTYDPMYQDGYEVRIMTSSQGPPTGGTGVLGNQVSNSTMIFSTAAEASSWTNHSVSLASYAGQSIYIGFRNNANDKFLLCIDDIQVSAVVLDDARITFVDTVTPYTIVPLAQVQPLNFNGTVNNNGANTLSNVYVTAEVFNSANTVVYTQNSNTIATLNAAASANYTIAGYTPSVSDDYYARFTVHHAVTDGNPANDTMWWNGYTVDDSTYARDDGNVTGALGIGAGNGGYMGQDFQVVNSDILTQVMTYVTTGYTGEPLAAVIWNMSGGVPTTIAAYTDTLIYPDDSARSYFMPIHNGPYSITPGQYAVTFIEFDSTLQIGLTNDNFETGHTWVNWPTSPFGSWANNEDFGSSFAKSYTIRPIFGDVCLNNMASATSTQASCISCNDGSATVTTSGTDGVVTYMWSPTGGNATTATGLATGVYTVTVTDGFGCISTATVNVGYDVCGLFGDTTMSADATCGTCADGSAQVIVSGSNGPLTYSWSNGGTSDTIQNVLPGMYYVTVTDSAGCTTTDSVLVNFNTGIAGINMPGAIGIYPNPNNGVFQIDVNLAESAEITVIVTNVEGKIVATKNAGSMKNGRIEMNLDVASGAYLVHVRSNDSEKIIPIHIQK